MTTRTPLTPEGNFSLEEMTFSNTAATRGIDNTAPPHVVDTLILLATKLELIRAKWKNVMPLTNAYRSAELNRAIGGAVASSHMTGEAADVADPLPARAFARWCCANEDFLQKIGIWCEDPQWTPGWMHLQIRPVPGIKVFYRPSMAPAKMPKLKEQGGKA